MSMDESLRIKAEPDDVVVNFEGEPSRQPKRSAPRKKTVKATPILHFLSTQAFASPFDVNMAVDAGFNVVIPHTNVLLEHARGLVQDAIFSRPPQYGCRTAIFIGGKDALLALDMLAAAKSALVPPFTLSALADPGGSFTTAAAMVACVEEVFRSKTSRPLKGATVAVFGATGVVGFASAVIAALQGAKVEVVSHMGLKPLKPLTRAAKERFGVDLVPVLGGRDTDKAKIVARADIVLCAAAAGIRVLGSKHLRGSKKLKVVADVNAVPPSGIEGVELFDFGASLPSSAIASVGPLAIGDIKYKTQAKLLRQMIDAQNPMMLDFTHAFEVARKLVRLRK
ncbi:methylene-tetrahydromethanopterin dehydrogenase N-terminal domain-containing protein [Hyphomicrobium sp.]|uniref:methylene-tetrahydromethanopterin dehydrogenase N-terminal domain-containing protein n=1 Tax=Hyphomicrobium sp. TaxID=82 RepID=UPI003562A802